LELLHLAFTLVVMPVFVVMAALMLYVMLRALRLLGFTILRPSPSMLAKELMCPKCER